jgi:hypothetical protein
MRLVIREYIAMLKESRELDSLLCTLLLAMGIEPWSQPQIGVRQDGVDIAATGKDPEDGKEKVFLFVIKQGDIDRNSWDSGKQAVRPTLVEVLDIYIPNRIPPEFKKLPVQVVVCCGGNMRQDVEQNWTGFAKQHRRRQVAFSFWGADRLTLLLEKHLLNEFIFSTGSQKLLRKTLATVGEPDANIENFSKMVSNILDEIKPSNTKKAVKALKSINLALRILFHWCIEEDNLNPAYLAAERTLLAEWDWLRKNSLWKKALFISGFDDLYNTYLDISSTYFEKLRPLFLVQDGMSRYACTNTLELHLWAFETMGRIAIYGINLLGIYSAHKDKHILAGIERVADTLNQFIRNNPITRSPAIDGHGIEIGLVLTMFTAIPRYHNVAREWLNEMIGKISFAYKCGCHYPVSSDSFDDLLDMNFHVAKDKKELTALSTLFPLFAEWCLLLNDRDAYDHLMSELAKTFPHTNLQLWFPDATTDDFLYKTNAGLHSGASYCSIDYPLKMDDLGAEIKALQNKVFDARELSCMKMGMPILALISSRHFRTPVIPLFWQQHIIAQVSKPAPVDSSVASGGENSTRLPTDKMEATPCS